MRLFAAIIGSLTCSSGALAGAFGGLHERQLDFHLGHQRTSHLLREARSTTPSPAVQQTQSWDAQAETACLSQLAKLNGVASNPAGMAVCYNLSYMNNQTGVFEAQLRLYNISVPTEEWAGITTNSMMVSLAYLGATVELTNGTLHGLSKREIHVSEAELAMRAELSERAAATTGPEEIQVLTYIGQLNGNVRGPQMNL